jgi:hypothetical protein
MQSQNLTFQSPLPPSSGNDLVGKLSCSLYTSSSPNSQGQLMSFLGLIEADGIIS